MNIKVYQVKHSGGSKNISCSSKRGLYFNVAFALFSRLTIACFVCMYINM